MFEHPAEYSSTFVGECLVFISHCVSRLETLDEKMRKKNPLNFVRSPLTRPGISSWNVQEWATFDSAIPTVRNKPYV